MARTALADVELGGKQIRKGDRVAMWYVSGNRDADAMVDPDQFRLDRPDVRSEVTGVCQPFQHGGGVRRVDSEHEAARRLGLPRPVGAHVMKVYRPQNNPTPAYLAGVRPGDVILTGTPAGVGIARDPQVFLKAGDQVSATIEGVKPGG